MPKRRKKKKVTKHKYYYYYEPIVECMVCGNEHLRRQRKKFVPKDRSRFLCIRLCPKCNGESYVLVGDREVRRIKKDEDKTTTVEMKQVVVIETNTGEVFDVSEFSLYVIPENNLGQFKKEYMPSFISLITKTKTSLKELLNDAAKEFSQKKYWGYLGLEMGIPGNVRAGHVTKVKNIKGDYISIPVSSIYKIKKVRRMKDEQ